MTTMTKSTKRYAFAPDYAVLPGRTLQETIDCLGIDQRELAARTGLDKKTINQIVQGREPITQKTAILLERVTGVPARTWNNLEMIYREQLAKVAEKERLAADLALLDEIPVKELIRRGKLKKEADKPEQLREVLGLFGVATVAAWRQGWEIPQFAYRKSLAFEGKCGPMAAWLRLGELEAQAVECQPFDKAKFKAAVDAIRALTVQPPEVFVPKMKEMCAAAGVAVVLVPEIKGAPVSGAAKWPTPDKGMICLNLRGKTNDKFWFTFFHEAGHILHDSKKETYIDVGYADDPREQQANRFAANHLIPPQAIQKMLDLRSYAEVESFAAEIGIAPGIVAGRIQHETKDFARFTRLKQRFQWAEA
jgi:addiction module HigA family antidote